MSAQLDPVPEPADPSSTNGNGALAYRNWQAERQGHPAIGGAEYGLYTDAHITGHVRDGLGPYQLLNTIPQPPPRLGDPAMALVLRADIHVDALPPREPKIETDADRWHGGWLDDEIAALVSLETGVRLMSGGRTRQFSNDEPAGIPQEFEHHPPHLVGPGPRGAVVPALARTAQLNQGLPLTASYPDLEPATSLAVLRAARSYQEGVWLTESDPQQAWIHLVASLETAAGFHWQDDDDFDPVAALADWKPDLADRLHAEGGHSLLKDVAEELVHQTRSTKKFLDFTLDHLPDPPTNRPDEAFQVDWTKMKQHLSSIYHHRSKFLHEARPLPGPLLRPPMHYATDKPAEERPSGLAETHGENTWNADELPMHLQTFEHITRGALRQWWAHLASLEEA